jgi:hypothetical protein
MSKKFSSDLEKAPGWERPAWRALQAWQILISKASDSSIITYEDLARMMGYADAHHLGYILSHIQYYCQQSGLPPLNSIVVSQETGLPGESVAVKPEQIPLLHLQVFRQNWFDIVPPTMEELIRACEACGKGFTES